MMSSGLKQIVLASCLLVSMLIGHASGCTCSHHEQAEQVEESCHSHDGSMESAETGDSPALADDDCICVVEQFTPSVSNTSAAKDLRSSDAAATPADGPPDLVSRPLILAADPSHDLVRNVPYLSTLLTLLPSRAPPRL